MTTWHLDTELTHAAAVAPTGVPLAPPIYQTTAFEAESAEHFAHLAHEVRGASFYTRYGNPNHAQAAAAIAALEGGEAGLVTASGMAALTTAVLALVGTGDHVVAQRSMYGGTTSVVRKLLPRLGVRCTEVDQTQADAWVAALEPRTRLLLLESPSNPLLEVTDLRAVARLARERGVVTLADNTFATPLNQRPHELGVDLVWHSATKYLGGHSDVSAGALTGARELLDRVWDMALLTGAVLGPFDAWLLLRGLRTLPLRIARHNENGLAVASALAAHPAVARVHYPGLSRDPGHAQAAMQMRGFGGVVSLVPRGGFAAADRLLEQLRLFRRSASLGSVESLAVHPAAMWTAMLSPRQLRESRIDDGLVRLACGLERADDLVADLVAALDRL